MHACMRACTIIVTGHPGCFWLQVVDLYNSIVDLSDPSELTPALVAEVRKLLCSFDSQC